jgi:hypothetical protein
VTSGNGSSEKLVEVVLENPEKFIKQIQRSKLVFTVRAPVLSLGRWRRAPELYQQVPAASAEPFVDGYRLARENRP